MISNFYYTAIMYKNIILVDHTEYEYNFYKEVKTFSKNFKENEGVFKRSETHNYIYIKDNEITFFTIVDSSVPEKTILAFLMSIKDEFNNKINRENSIDDSISEFCLKDFEGVLEEKMKFYEDNIGTMSNEAVTNLKNDIINFHKEVLRSNEKLLNRNENLGEINEKAKNLSSTSDFYFRGAKKVTCAAKKKRCFIIMFSVFAVLAIVYCLVGLNCGFDLNECI